jgi:hypothetical protein
VLFIDTGNRAADLEMLAELSKLILDPSGNGQAVNGHWVEILDGVVVVDGAEVHNDREYKISLGLDPDTKYPHPLGWTDDFATLDWQKESGLNK